MGLNSQIGGEVGMHCQKTMDLVYEKSIKQEQKIRVNSTCQERKEQKKDVEGLDKIGPKNVESVQNFP